MNAKREKLKSELEYNASLRDYEADHQKHLKGLEAERFLRLNQALEYSSKMKVKKAFQKEQEKAEDISIATTLASVKDFRSDEKIIPCGNCKRNKRALYMNKI